MRLFRILLCVLLLVLCIRKCEAQYNTSTGLTIPSIVQLPSDITNSNASPDILADVIGLQFPVTAGNIYYFRFYIYYEVDATSTGTRWTINGPTLTNVAYYNLYGTNGTASAMRWSNAYNGNSVSTSTPFTTGNVALLEGTIVCSANGNVIARFSSEVASPAFVTVKASKSFVTYQRVNP